MNSGKPPGENVYPFPGAAPSKTPALEGGNGGPHPPDMTDISGRVARVEGAVEGLRSSIDALRWVIGILALVIVGGISFLGVQLTRSDSRIATFEEKVDALPDKINMNLLNLTKTLSDAITAAKQAPPQVILMQPPTSPSPPMSPK